jgi:hypothetical protein
VEDSAEIRRLHRAERMPIKAIVRRLGVGRNTVRRALAADGPPKYERPGRGAIVDAVEPQIRELLGSWPSIAAHGDCGADRLGPVVDDAERSGAGAARPTPLRTAA